MVVNGVLFAYNLSFKYLSLTEHKDFYTDCRKKRRGWVNEKLKIVNVDHKPMKLALKHI